MNQHSNTELGDTNIDGAVARQSKSYSFLAIITDAVLLALIFLLPIFYLPGLIDGVELPKQLLLLALTTIAGVLWLLRVFFSRSITLRKSFFFFPLLLYVVGMGVATLTSLDRAVSLFGYSAGEYAGFATLVGLVLFLFLATTTEHDLGFVRRAMMSLFVSSIVLVAVILIKLFGWSVPGLPAVASWNPTGSVFGAGIFSVGMLLLASGALLFDPTEHQSMAGGRVGGVLRALAVISGILSLIFLVLLDWWVAWAMVLAGAGLLLLFVFIHANTFKHLARLLLPLLSFVLGLLFLFIRTPVGVNLPIEISPNATSSWGVAAQVLRDHPALGSGPATYVLDYVKYRPDVFTTTPLWNVRFDRAASFVLTMLPTTGIAGAILWLLLIGMMIGLVVRSFLHERDPNAWLLTVALFFPWVSLLVGQFLYSSNMTLEFLFWCMTALLVIATARRLSPFTFTHSPRALLGTSFGAVVFAVLMVILLLVGASRYAGWAAFANAVSANAANDLGKTRESLVRAADFDPRNDVFLRNLAQVRLFEASKASSTADLQNALNTAVAAAREATVVGPEDSQNWAMLGAVYREMAPVVTGSGELAIDAFGRAQELEPKNPAYATEIGRANLILADRAKQETQSKDDAVRSGALGRMNERLVDAERGFQNALSLKQDYAPAHFYLSLALEREGKLAEAIGKMESVARLSPQDVGVAFQLGLLYLEHKDTDKAEGQFVRALQLSPNYANAHWYLSTIYESRGEMDKAVKEVEAVLATNPDSQPVKDRLAQLKGGVKPATGLPAPVGTGEAQGFPR